MPLNTESSENSTTDGTSTRAGPAGPDRLPAKSAEIPHATANALTRLLP